MFLIENEYKARNGCLNSFFVKNIFYDLRRFYSRVTIFITEAYLGLGQISMIQLFVKIVNRF